MQCSQCGFCFSYPYVAGDERFYSLAYVRSGYPKWKWEFQITYDLLRRNLRSNCKLIEIGAGDGAFISKIAKDVLPKANIFCTEFFRIWAASDREMGHKMRTEGHQGDIRPRI